MIKFIKKYYSSFLLKALRYRINKKINKNYNQRQKALSEIKGALDIDFNKISYNTSEINISSHSSNNSDVDLETDSLNKTEAKTLNDSNDSNIENRNKEKPLFQIHLHNSIAGSQRFYYKGIEINSLSLEGLNNLRGDLDYILNEIEREIDKILI